MTAIPIRYCNGVGGRRWQNIGISLSWKESLPLQVRLQRYAISRTIVGSTADVASPTPLECAISLDIVK